MLYCFLWAHLTLYKYKECIAKFIVGQMDIDTEWDAFQTELKNMNIDRYLEIIQTTSDASAFAGK